MGSSNLIRLMQDMEKCSVIDDVRGSSVCCDY